jgi:hypothetical protein
MKRQRSAVAALSGLDRYLIIDALERRIGVLQIKARERARNQEPFRADLDRLEQSLQALKDRLSDDVALHLVNLQYLGPELAAQLAQSEGASAPSC